MPAPSLHEKERVSLPLSSKLLRVWIVPFLSPFFTGGRGFPGRERCGEPNSVFTLPESFPSALHSSGRFSACQSPDSNPSLNHALAMVELSSKCCVCHIVSFYDSPRVLVLLCLQMRA